MAQREEDNDSNRAQDGEDDGGDNFDDEDQPQPQGQPPQQKKHIPTKNDWTPDSYKDIPEEQRKYLQQKVSYPPQFLMNPNQK